MKNKLNYKKIIKDIVDIIINFKINILFIRKLIHYQKIEIRK